MFYVTRSFEFDSAHRLFGYDGPCARTHGHRYVAEVTVRGENLDALGMLVDFGELSKVKRWIDEKWDHRLICHGEDEKAGEVGDSFVFASENPTAEVMARMLFRVVKSMVPKNVAVWNIRLCETPNCWADYNEQDA